MIRSRPVRAPDSFSARYIAYEGVQASACGESCFSAARSFSVFPTPTGICVQPIASKAVSDAPATKGPAPKVVTTRSPALRPFFE